MMLFSHELFGLKKWPFSNVFKFLWNWNKYLIYSTFWRHLHVSINVYQFPRNDLLELKLLKLLKMDEAFAIQTGVEVVTRRCSVKKVFLEISRKETLGQIFSCEFCQISKSTFFTEHLLVTTSESFCYTTRQ